MLTRKGFISLCVTAWLIKDIEVEAYVSGCSGGYCFVISDISHTNELLDQSGAQRRCQSNGTQLVEIQNAAIQNALIDFIRTAYMQGFNNWNVLTNGKRSLGSWIRLSGNGIGGLTIYDQTDLSYSYGYLKSTSSGLNLFASRPTDRKEGFVCSGFTDCSGAVPINGQCYKSFTETLSWYDARNRCLDAGGDLASFDHITTNAGFNALNGSWISTSNIYWIGIRREWWTWQTTSSDVKYSAWMSGHPINDDGRANSDCLCLWTTNNYWKWIECGCYQTLPFVCISATPTTTTTTTTTTTRSSATNASTIKTSSEATLAVVSKSNGISTPTIASTVTSVSRGNDSGSIGQPMGLTCTAVGVTVGLCIGIPLIIVIVALAVVIARQKKQFSEAHLSPKANHAASSKNRIQQTTAGDIGELSDVTEGPYESMQPRLEGMTDGCYQSLNLSKKTDNAIRSSNT